MSAQAKEIKIQWLGHSCFQITSGEGTVIVTDPYDSSLGLKLPENLQAHIVTVSHQHFDHNYVQAVAEPYIQVKEPGVFVHKDVVVNGINSFHDQEEGKQRGKNLVFTLSMQGCKIAHLGDLGHVLAAPQLAQIGQVDVLLVPIGGYYTMELEAVLENIHLIEPKVIIPMHYKYGKLALSIGNLQSFTEHYPHLSPDKRSEFTYTKESVGHRAGQVVLLQDPLNT